MTCRIRYMAEFVAAAGQVGLAASASSESGEEGGGETAALKHEEAEAVVVHHVLTLVEVLGGEEQKGLFAVLSVARDGQGGRRKTVKEFSNAAALTSYLKQLPAERTPHTLSLASGRVAQPAVAVEITKERFKHLKMLKLETPHSEEVLQAVFSLSHLVELDISHCKISENLQYEMTFGEAECLASLSLDHINLRRLHPSIGRLRNLQRLSLQYNRLTSLPLTVRLLRHLHTLDIAGNPFSSLPGTIFHLHALRTLTGFNECPLQKKEGERWVDNSNDGFISWAPPLLKRTPLEEVESLQEICIRSAVGMDCWQIPLPPHHHDHLVELARDFDLCEECLQPVRKLTVYQETSGYTIQVQLALFRGIRDLPFDFFACCGSCSQKTMQKFKELQKTLQSEILPQQNYPTCSYVLQCIQDLHQPSVDSSSGTVFKFDRKTEPAGSRCTLL